MSPKIPSKNTPAISNFTINYSNLSIIIYHLLVEYFNKRQKSKSKQYYDYKNISHTIVTGSLSAREIRIFTPSFSSVFINLSCRTFR